MWVVEMARRKALHEENLKEAHSSRKQTFVVCALFRCINFFLDDLLVAGHLLAKLIAT